MSRTARLLELLIVLQTKPRFTVDDLAGETGVSRRTMLRDLHALSEMGVPLAATPGPGGGYSLLRDRRLLPLSLSAEEAIGVLLSYEAFLQYAASPFETASLSAISKIRAALPADVVRELDRMRRYVVVTEAARSARAPHLGELLQAALDGVHLDVTYESRSRVSDRRIFPYGLYASQGLWYCLCHDERRGRTLSLRADRVLGLARATGVDPPEPLAVRDWLLTWRNEATDLVPIRLRVTRDSARRVEMETLFGRVDVDEHGMGLVESQIPASEIDFYARQLLSFGAGVVVESPRELAAVIRERAGEVIWAYSEERVSQAEHTQSSM